MEGHLGLPNLGLAVMQESDPSLPVDARSSQHFVRFFPAPELFLNAAEGELHFQKAVPSMCLVARDGAP